MLERLQVKGAPKPQGPYSSVVRAGDFLFVSGQGPVDAETGEMQSEATVQDQTRLVLRHVQTILRGCGADLQDVVKCSVFLHDVRDFEAMNEVYTEFFGANKPARTTIGAGMVATGMKVEIDCIAYRPATA
jgi:2-iminobutanoate/2-iminopropanoate deaminase